MEFIIAKKYELSTNKKDVFICQSLVVIPSKPCQPCLSLNIDWKFAIYDISRRSQKS
ncbi:hypothetical protein XFF6992_460005 [Xanthomonas citri pv. fuscans]|nr:hypothetical protein XFF7767_990005 [Xanthomonas citri pv. fuscans]SOO12475.1 hypothetical protein XFF7766_1110006 [Xanthomonas citri pv. fuscans]SOO20375.1 hypothetical protein XFF6992_460005 [Xanthomonas citri pv. fuscans]